MRRFVTVLVLAALAVSAGADNWKTSGTLTNPTVGTVLVDSGPMPTAGQVAWCFLGASTAVTGFVLEHRNVANSATIRSQILTVPANGTEQFCAPPNALPELLVGERLRVTLFNSVTGTVSVSLFHTVP